jgi:oxygen-independent coproporphyrinogen-3 oxidase
VARALGRGHDARDARDLVELASEAGFASLSFDLIFGVPGQTLADFDADLEQTIALGAGHVSLYGLTILEGTAFARRGVAGPDDDTWRALYDRAVERLPAAGLERYEVANFARPGHRARHNELYWRGRPWAGLGVGAHGWWPDGARTTHGDDVDAYLAGPPSPRVERPAAHELAAELIGSTLRHVDGLDRGALRAWTGLDVLPPSHLLAGGLLVADDAHVRLGFAGFPLADALAARLCATLHDTSASRREV